MANQRVQIILEAVDETKAAFSSASSGMGKLREGINAHSFAITAALTGVTTAVVGIAKKSLDAFAEQEEVSTRLRALILNQSGATMENVKALEQQAAAMQQVTTFGDEVVMSAQAMLATFDFSSDAIQAVIPSFLDMVAAEKGAAVGIDEMAQMANGLGKAMQGNTELFSKMGFEITDIQKKALETGNEQQRLATITEILGGTYKGVAGEIRDTFGGEMIVLKNQIGDVGEEIGAELVPIMRDVLIPFMSNQLVPFIQDTVIPGLRNLKIGIEVVADAWDSMTTAISNVMIKFDELKAKIPGLKESISGLIKIGGGSLFGSIGGKLFDKFFADGGIVQGQGAVPIVAHAGEMILNKQQQSQLFNALDSPRQNTINLGGITINNQADSDQFFRRLNQMLGGNVEGSRLGV